MKTIGEAGPDTALCGYRVVPIRANEKRPVFAGWQNKVYTAVDLTKPELKSYGVGLACGAGSGGCLCAIDIDITEPVMAHRMRIFAEALLGENPPTRFGSRPKLAMLYRTTEPWAIINSAGFAFEGAQQRIQVLGLGQQLVVFGVHPGTGAEYEWVNGDPSEVDLEDLQVITRDQVDQLIMEFEHAAEAEQWVAQTDQAESRAPMDADDAVLLSLVEQAKQPTKHTPTEVAKILATIGPDGANDYQKWLDVGMALAHQFQHDRETGFQLWWQFGQLADNGKTASEDVARAKWATFKPYGGARTVAFPSVLKLLKQTNASRDLLDDKDRRKLDQSRRKRMRDVAVAALNNAVDSSTLLQVLRASWVWTTESQGVRKALATKARELALERGYDNPPSEEQLLDAVNAASIEVAEISRVERALARTSAAVGHSDQSMAEFVNDKIGHTLGFHAADKEFARYDPATATWAVGPELTLSLSQEVQTIVSAQLVTEMQSPSVQADKLQMLVRREALKKIASSAGLSAVMQMLRIKVDQVDGLWDDNPRYFAVGNGVYDTHDERLLPFTEQVPMLRSLHMRNRTSVNYVPGATAPTLIELLDLMVYGSLEKIEYIQRALGSAMLGEPRRAKKLINLVGKRGGNNGKSTLIEALETALEGLSAQIESKTIVSQHSSKGVAPDGARPRPDLIALHGKRMVMTMDAAAGAYFQEDTLKALTSDPQVTRTLYSATMQKINPPGLILMASNEAIEVRSQDMASIGRVDHLLLTRNLRDDPTVARKYVPKEFWRREAEGVLAWLVEGMKQFKKQGWLVLDEIVSERRSRVESTDYVGNFLLDIFEPDPAGFVSSSDLFALWQSYAGREGVLRLVQSATMLTRQIRENNKDGYVLKYDRRGGERGWCGLTRR